MNWSLDGFKNILKGLGGDKDGRMHRQFVPGINITQQIADNLYAYNWLAAKVVDTPVEDATRKWRNLLIPDPGKKEDIEEVYKKFDIKGKFDQALKWARVFGGAVIVMVVDGDQEQPLDIDKVRIGQLKNLIVLDRYNITATVTDRNILSINLGQPEFYQVVRNGQKIHHSRVIKFDGQKPTIHQAERNNFWGLSIFTKLWEPISDSQETSDAIANLIYESNVDVYRIAGFNELVATSEELAIKRIKIAHKMKSIVNGIVLDREDEYEKKTNTFTTLPDIDDRFIQKVAGASEIPVTRLLGTSPAGQNATGESDMRNYYDSIQALQENIIRPRLDIVDKVVLGSAGYTDEFAYEFKPLQQLTEKEQAEVDFKTAQRDQVYLDQDIITALDVIAQLAERGTYIIIDSSRIEHEKEEAEMELEFAEENENGQSGEEPEGSGKEIPEGAEETG